jgi:hypothetical protein
MLFGTLECYGLLMATLILVYISAATYNVAADSYSIAAIFNIAAIDSKKHN